MNKRILSKIGATCMCIVLAVSSVIAVNAASRHDFTETSKGVGNKNIKMETTGQTVLCRKGYKFPNSSVTARSNFKMPQIKLGRREVFNYYVTYVGADAGWNYTVVDAYTPANSFMTTDWESAMYPKKNKNIKVWVRENKTRSTYRRYTASIAGLNKCRYNLIAWDIPYYEGGYAPYFYDSGITSANALYSKYPTVAVTVYDEPTSVTLKRSDNKSSITGKTVTLRRGQTLSVYECTPKGSYANAKNITYHSSKSSVATVTKDGTFKSTAKIKALRKGRTTVKVTLYNGETAYTYINVK